MNEIERLMKEKELLERRIKLLTQGSVIMDTVKLDQIHHPAANCGKWSVAYKYKHIARLGRGNDPQVREKWVPIICCENREEAVNMLGEAIKALTELYEKAVK